MARKKKESVAGNVIVSIKSGDKTFTGTGDSILSALSSIEYKPTAKNVSFITVEIDGKKSKIPVRMGWIKMAYIFQKKSLQLELLAKRLSLLL